ncbi:hypothetical protein DUNSADRAFT_10327 [Dunaliella salina]|uniref:Encoded protein n=1 Tax=Dunaliella salina TaxID=3046 RepID=A0ABQ7H4V8_DUNSA|nr:hypothetical protein DUNSADRAFT_10327 [Dunaliella salina]|eukprot:KAF5841890.1 hypothetical protein DUNSADRAFT_10327 [Dunaliella salina]
MATLTPTPTHMKNKKGCQARYAQAPTIIFHGKKQVPVILFGNPHHSLNKIYRILLPASHHMPCNHSCIFITIFQANSILSHACSSHASHFHHA